MTGVLPQEESKRPLQRISHGGICSHYALEYLHFLFVRLCGSLILGTQRQKDVCDLIILHLVLNANYAVVAFCSDFCWFVC